MAAVALVAGCDVLWRQTGGGQSIVARGTGTDDGVMVNFADTAEGDRVVAIITYCVRKNMRRGFSGCDTVVMTGLAITLYITVFKACAFPGAVCMTVIAGITAGKMLWMFAGCAAAVVAAAAVQWCSLELAGQVTAGTVDKFMLAGQRKTGREMVEAVRLACRLCW